MFQRLYDLIQQYDTITIFRHVNPDGDAFGSQLGLKDIIETSFPNKKVYALGSDGADIQRKLFKQMDQVEDEVIQNSLAIICDTANHERIDDTRYMQAKHIVKIDHHIIVDSYGNDNIEIVSACATSEIVTQFLMEMTPFLTISVDGASYLYTGILTDSGRFMYASTSQHTFEMAAFLVKQGIDLEHITQTLYMKKAKDLQTMALIYQNYQVSTKGIAYYILTRDMMDTIQINREQASSYVYLLAGVEEYPIWMAVTQMDDLFKVSIRSRLINIQPIAALFNGGGHAHACGLTLNSIKQLEELIHALEQLI